MGAILDLFANATIVKPLMPIDTFLFDIGNVLLNFDFQITARRIAPLCGVPEEDILGRMDDLKVPLETGQLSGEDFLSTAASRLAFRGPPLELKRAFQEIFTPNQAAIELVETLCQQEYRMVILSNTNALHAEYFLWEFPVFSRFQERVFSHDAGVMKPDSRIFMFALETLGLNPANTFYIDDLAPNIDAGRSLGFPSHLYQSEHHEALLDSLRLLSVPV